jgi:hypothetical protein
MITLLVNCHRYYLRKNEPRENYKEGFEAASKRKRSKRETKEKTGTD